ncbi:MAG: hypothetical protein DWQ36_03290 [Acidobacteria bacterium]|nr:MAG: hypothetical protein DWQ30_17020 [Acidobacteriota bacterium]REK10990.1 MAG: hypothetical protein DWQ36_03290 [Acidobacteriota bacterium]
MSSESPQQHDPLDELEEQGLVAEFWQFLKENKKWWLIPILLSIALLGGLVLLSGTGAAPFIYTLF